MKSLKPYLLVFALSIVPLVTLFVTPDMVHTHDGPVHLARLAAYYKALSDGQFPPRWAASLNYGYGTPLLIFMYPLPYLLGSLYLALGFNLIMTFKLLLTTSFVLSGIFMYAFASLLTKSKPATLLVTLLYQFAPFRFVELTVRGSVAEAFAYAFLPAALWGLARIMAHPTYFNLILTSLASAFLILSHNSISLIFFMIAFFYILFFANKTRVRLICLGALGTGLLLSSFYWLPALLERKYTYGDLFMQAMYKNHFAPWYQFFLPNFTNDTKLQTGGVAISFGAFQVLATIYAIWILIKKKSTSFPLKNLLIFGLTILATSFFFMQPISQFLWERVALLRQFQFPWRFLSAAVFATALLASSLLTLKHFHNPRFLSFFLGLAILSTVYYWWPPLGFDKIDLNYFWNYPLNTTYFGEADVIWAAGQATGYPKQKVEIVEGQGLISNFSATTTKQNFAINSPSATSLVSHTLFFPGWQVYVDGVKTPIQFQDSNWRGLIKFNVTAGSHLVEIIFKESKVRLLADLISLTTALTLTIGTLKFGKKSWL
ncbi:MAG: 6-pyruvoyl-tetrahydropterin synthase-related protein [Patescibacteria group bacterium]